LLRKRFARFESCGRGTRPEQQMAGLGKTISDAGTEGQLGSDDCEIDVLAVNQGEYGVEVAWRGRTQSSQLADAGVSGCAPQLAHVPIGREPGDQRVLARTAPDNENPHDLNDLGRETRLQVGFDRPGLFR